MVTLVRLGHFDHRAALLLLGVVVAVAPRQPAGLSLRDPIGDGSRLGPRS
jgi:hypothetical protein